ncbi:hypothetical protein RvY_01014 [Ramazzottius varieornatus]|uniref:WD and tetratricopeptide repeats protein 1 n=1 Tax=Ramazzottius varieornatus TaxID=947166 RepID=A0A1D1UKW6_RAMVA|nr:hypothetical protein RvY_01014 [Ramazzottius varieornatus]
MEIDSIFHWGSSCSSYGAFGIRSSYALQSEARYGLISPVQFRRMQQWSVEFVRRLGLFWELKGHEGCVNCIEWNHDGTLLASGSDDYRVRIWDIPHRKEKHVIATGHTGNIFGVKFLPGSADNIVISAAADGTVRVFDVNYQEMLYCFSCHVNRVKRVAVSPDSPSVFWSAGEDGLVIQYDLREPKRCDANTCRQVLINLNPYMTNPECKSIACNPVQMHYMAVGATDCFTRMYDRRKLKLSSITYPNHMFDDSRGLVRRYSWLSSHNTEVEPLEPGCVKYFAPGHLPQKEQESRNQWRNFSITDVRFSADGTSILSNIGGEQIYLFSVSESSNKVAKTFSIGEQSPLRSKNIEEISEYAQKNKDLGNEYYHRGDHNSAIAYYNRALLMSPRSSVLYSNRAVALIKRKWDGDSYQALLDAYMAYVLDPANEKAHFRLIKGLALVKRWKEAKEWCEDFHRQYDNRRQLVTSPSFLELEQQITDALKANRNGKRSRQQTKELSAMETQEIKWREAASDYRNKFVGHCNTTTDIKEAGFLGQNGEFIMAGSDDGSFFIWDRKSTNLVKVIRGDSNIVNCLQPHPTSCVIATSGIDNEVRLWAPRAVEEKDETEEPARRSPAGAEPASGPIGTEVEDVTRATDANQRRMNADPWTMILGDWIQNQANAAGAGVVINGPPNCAQQ